jgi:hypothetical protein
MLSQRTRKIILWSATIILGIVLIFLWLKSFQKQIANFEGQRIFGNLSWPKIEMPKLPEINLNYGQEATTTE